MVANVEIFLNGCTINTNLQCQQCLIYNWNANLPSLWSVRALWTESQLASIYRTLLKAVHDQHIRFENRFCHSVRRECSKCVQRTPVFSAVGEKTVNMAPPAKRRRRWCSCTTLDSLHVEPVFIRHAKLLYLSDDKQNLFYLFPRARVVLGIRKSPRHLHETLQPTKYPAHNCYALGLALANVVYSVHATAVVRPPSRPQCNAVTCGVWRKDLL